MRISSYSLPQRATHFSEGTARVSRFGPTPEQRKATLALLKTRNRLIVKDRMRLWKQGVRDLVMEICCALHNFRVRLIPWRPMM
jgi:hypothetical protein